LQRRLDQDLETIILVALEKNPARRYESALALAEDMERWLRGEPIKARPRARVVRIGRWLRRHRVVSAAILVFVLALPAYLLIRQYTDPNREGYLLRERLHGGEKVELIGPEEAPGWFRWIVPGTVGALGKDNAFAPHTGQVSLMELLPAPLPERYRLGAEIHTSPAGDVGMFVGYCRYPIPQGDLHTFIRFYARERRLPKKDIQIDTVLDLTHFVQPQLSAGYNSGYQIKSSTFPKKTSWHRFLAEMTPDECRFYWDGQLGGTVHARHLPTAATALVLRKNIDRVDFSLQGSLGIYLSKSTGCFRNVWVEKMDGPSVDYPSWEK
jgi:hypothetical protein